MVTNFIFNRLSIEKFNSTNEKNQSLKNCFTFIKQSFLIVLLLFILISSKVWSQQVTLSDGQSVAQGNIGQGVTRQLLMSFQIYTTEAVGLTQVNFTTEGNYTAATDLQNTYFNLWCSTSSTFDATATMIGNYGILGVSGASNNLYLSKHR